MWQYPETQHLYQKYTYKWYLNDSLVTAGGICINANIKQNIL